MIFESVKLYKDERLDYEDFFKKIVEFGYRPAAKVNEEGDFSRRGEIIDIFPLTFEYPVRIELFGKRIEKIRSFDINTGKPFESHAAIIVLPIAGIHKRKIKLKPPIDFEESPINAFVDIEAGDYVVHIDHGIGIYRGIQKLKKEKKYIDHFVIEFAGKAKLFVRQEDLDKIQKYLSFAGPPPKLYKLASGEWQRIKSRAKHGIALIANELLELQAKRHALDGYGFSQDTDWQKKVEESFPYKETPDQARATKDVKLDMESKKPMDRLLCGDVGYGKTEVALRAAFKAVMDNKQVCILVPTTILAEQHQDTFQARLKDYPVNIEMLSRFKTKMEQRGIVKRLADGSVDIIIGTHRLLSDDIKFKDLGLVIIDEEQRFGVKDKEKLKKMRLLVDVLTLTATPIPRTLYMSLMGAKDISIINTPPVDRLPVKTIITDYNEALIKNAILSEMKRKGQVFFVNNRVMGIEKIKTMVAGLVPSVRIAVVHGQMDEHNLEKTMFKFIHGEIDVLVSTTIIESGIDVPNANTLIVNRADAFGLADLYQLRGRVGRFNRSAFAYLLLPKKIVLTKNANKRLDSILLHQNLGAGFKIAMEDLQIRGAGNLLGKEQHGFVRAIGFDLYCRLLRAAVDFYAKHDHPKTRQ